MLPETTVAESFGIFRPVLPMVFIFHSPVTFANSVNHKYSIGSNSTELGGWALSFIMPVSHVKGIVL